MVDVATPEPQAQSPVKTVLEYIDELPVWSDGTTLKSTPMTGMQWRIWALAASGKFFEGFVVFMGGVRVPPIAREFHLAAAETGLVTSASLAGILVGTILLGSLSDYFGRKRMFIAEMIIFCMFLALLIMVGNFWSLVICLFGVGMALGCDYPTAHMIISENIPSASRGRLVLGAFAFQAVGAMCGIGIGAVVLVLDPDLDAWRWMYATALVPAVIITVGRFFIPESANWLIVRGAHEQAEQAVTRCSSASRSTRSRWHSPAMSPTRRVRRNSPSWRCSTRATSAPRSSLRLRGSCRISALLAGLAGVPQDLLDAAMIDGAGALRRFRSVTLPMLGPTLGFVVPIALLNAVTQVDHVVTMTQGGPSDATNLLIYYIYQQAGQNFDTGLASSATVISVAALLTLSLTSFRLIERGIHYES